MNKIVYKLVYNRKKCLDRRGQALVQAEAYLKGKKKFFSTHIYLKPGQWDKEHLLVRRHPNAEALNRQLHDFVAGMERRELDLWRRGEAVSLERLKAEMERTEGDGDSFTDFFRHETERATLRESTRRNLLSTLALLETFRKDIAFHEVDFGLVAAFEHFLLWRGYHVNTVAKHLRHLKRQVNAAIAQNRMEQRDSPFRLYKIHEVEHRHTYLTPEELLKLERFVPRGRHAPLRHVLDAFLFCCYTGMRYSDFVNLSPANVATIRREPWLLYRSVKTRTEVRLPLRLLFGGKGLEILQRYDGRLDTFFRLPHNSNANKRLRVIGRLAGVDKAFSFHSARHTNATLLIYKGVNITTVQKLLGHRSVRTTQTYANVMDSTIVRDLETHRF